MTELRSYIRDGAEIYRNSFAIIRAEANLSRFKQNEEKLAVRIIHACGMVDIADDLLMSPTFAASARAALLRGAPILCDAKMVAHGITRNRLPRSNSVICTLDDPAVLASLEKYDQPVKYMNTDDYTRFQREQFVKERAIIERLGLLLKT